MGSNRFEAFDGDEHLGEWWLSDKREHPVPGVLRVLADGSARLLLIGSLYPFIDLGESSTTDGETRVEFSSESQERRSRLPIVQGRVGVKAFTLLECYSISHNHSLFGDATGERQVVAVGGIIEGALFDPGEKLEFSRINFHLDHLTHWMTKTGMKETARYTVDENNIITGGDGMGLEARVLDSLQFKAAPHLDGEIRHVLKPFGDKVESRGFKQEFYLSIGGEKLTPLSELLDRCGDIQDLLSVATGSVAAVRSITLEHPAIAQHINGVVRPTPMNYRVQWRPRRPANYYAIPAHEMRFTLADLGGVPGLERWMVAVSDKGAVLSRVVMSMIERGTMYTSDRVINCAAALEGYDTASHPKQENLKNRLLRCASKAGDPFTGLVGDVDAWCKLLKEQRNAVAHHGAFGQADIESALASSAYWLAMFCLLRDAAAPDVVFENISRHASFLAVKRHIAAAMM